MNGKNATADKLHPRSPQWLDRRSSALKQRIAAKLRTQPELLNIGLENMKRWQEPDGTWGRHTVYMTTWTALIHQGLNACLEVLEDETESTQALRSCAPFAGVLSEQERTVFFQEWRP